MPLKIQRPNVHDNTDGDLIIINKSKLSNHLHLIRNVTGSLNTVLALLGLAAAFIMPALIVESYKDIGLITAEVIRAILIVLGIVSLGYSVYNFFVWRKVKDRHDPDALVSELLEENPIQLKTVLYQIKDSKDEKKK